MSKTAKAILLVVLLVFSFHYAVAEETMEELDTEFDSLMDRSERILAIRNVILSGLPFYPESSIEDDYTFDSSTVFPDIPAGEHGLEYNGMPFLITGTVLDVKGYGIDFQLDDGRKAIIDFNPFDFETLEMLDFGTAPWKGDRCNIFCTFVKQSWELIDDNCLHFIASVTEDAKRLSQQRNNDF